MKSIFKKVLVPSLVAVVSVWAPSRATAANISIDDLTETLSVSATQFDVTGATVTHMNIFNGEDDVRIFGEFFSNSDAGLSGDSWAFMNDQGCQLTDTACMSDVVHVTWSTSADPNGFFNSIASLTLDFGSDPEALGTCGGNCNANSTILEDGTFQDMTRLLSLPDNITIQVASDVEAQVPEPATLSLLGLGLVGLGLRARRKA